MYVTNRDLGVMAAAVFIVAACAVLMMVNVVPDRVRSAPVETDTLAVVPEVTREGGAAIDPNGPLVVHAVGKPPDSVLLTCDMFKAQRGFEGSTAWFSSLPVGDCAIAFPSARPYQPVYPGDELRCSIEDGRTVCAGGLATSRAAHVSVESRVPAVLSVDDEVVGPLPAKDLSLRVGRRSLKLTYTDGRFARYALVVEPDQHIRVVFPVPAGLDPASLQGPVAPAPEVAPAIAAPSDATSQPPVAVSTDEDDTGGSADR